MKIFVVTADIELTQQPKWLEGFRNRYDKPYDYHVTLKQPCFIEDEKVNDIKNKLHNLFMGLTIPNHTIPLTFNTLKVSKDAPGDICVMINSPDKAVRNLQKQVASALSDYISYYKPEYKTYEENFDPHITIARDLNEQTYFEASKELEHDYTCEGVIKNVILTVVNNFGPEEANDPANKTLYPL